MTKGEKMVCVYVPQELLNVLNEYTYKKAISKSGFVRDLLLDYFSKGDDDLKVKLLGRES